MRTSPTLEKIAVALNKAQKKMGAATKDAKNTFFKTNYADLGSIMEVVKPALNEEGITILQPTFSKVDASQMVHFVETVLLHESGEFIASEPLKLELTKSDMQALGSAVSYARRYSMQSLLSVPVADDDSESAMLRPKASAPEKMIVTNTPAIDQRSSFSSYKKSAVVDDDAPLF